LGAFVAVTRRIEETAVEEGLTAQQANLQAEIAKLAADLAGRRQAFDQAVADMQAELAQLRTRLTQEADALAGQVADLKRQKAAVQADMKEVRHTAVSVPNDDQPAGGLTDRQRQILAMLRQDISQADMATSLGVSERTVRRDISKLNGLVKEIA